MNLIFYLPHLIINVANAVLAGKVIHQNLGLYLSGIYPLIFTLGAFLTSKYFKNFTVNLLQFNLLWVLFLVNNCLYIFSNNLLITIITFFINAIIVTLQNSYFSKFKFENYWHLILISFALGRVIGGCFGFIEFRYVYFAQLILVVLLLILINLKIEIKVDNLNQSKLNLKIPSIITFLLFSTQSILLTTWNCMYTISFHQKAIVTAIGLLLTNLIQIFVISNKTINYWIYKLKFYLLFTFICLWIIFILQSNLVYIGIICSILTLSVINIILSNCLNYKSNIYLLLCFQLIAGIMFYISHILIIIYTLTCLVVILCIYIITKTLKKKAPN